jgi:hypothetical protein
MTNNDVASFFYYMWNSWSKEECMEAFFLASCEWEHYWNKWVHFSKTLGTDAAISRFFASLDNDAQDLLVKRALELYNRKSKKK